jgi:hypothetical protein
MNCPDCGGPMDTTAGCGPMRCAHPKPYVKSTEIMALIAAGNELSSCLADYHIYTHPGEDCHHCKALEAWRRLSHG